MKTQTSRSEIPQGTPPPFKYAIKYYRDRVDEAQAKINAGDRFVNYEEAKHDWCMLRIARMPDVQGAADEAEAPAPKKSEGQLILELGYRS